MSATVTDKLCKQAFARLQKELDDEYARRFPYVSATDAFWTRLDHVDRKLTETLKQRPLTRAEIASLGARAFKALRATMLKVAKTITQPQFRECTDAKTGKVRRIPEYD